MSYVMSSQYYQTYNAPASAANQPAQQAPLQHSQYGHHHQQPQQQQRSYANTGVPSPAPINSPLPPQQMYSSVNSPIMHQPSSQQQQQQYPHIYSPMMQHVPSPMPVQHQQHIHSPMPPSTSLNTSIQSPVMHTSQYQSVNSPMMPHTPSQQQYQAPPSVPQHQHIHSPLNTTYQSINSPAPNSNLMNTRPPSVPINSMSSLQTSPMTQVGQFNVNNNYTQVSSSNNVPMCTSHSNQLFYQSQMTYNASNQEFSSTNSPSIQHHLNLNSHTPQQQQQQPFENEAEYQQYLLKQQQIQKELELEWQKEAEQREKQQQRKRFLVELEFVQSLANPNYLNHLAKQGLLDNASFRNYLKYLLYWKEPEYIRYIKYPQCLFYLDLLQRDDLRESIKSNKLTNFLNEQQVLNWRFYTNNILNKQMQNASESALSLNLDSNQSEPQSVQSNNPNAFKNTIANTKATKNVSKASNTTNSQKKLKTDSNKAQQPTIERSKEVPNGKTVNKLDNKSDSTTNGTLKQQKSKSNLKSTNSLNELLNCKVLSANNTTNSSAVLNSTSKQSVKFHKL